MAKGKKKKSAAKKAPAEKTPAETAPPRKRHASDVCPECSETRPLWWHGRRVLCQPCIEDNTHEAERGEVTMGGLLRGAMSLFREVGLWAVLLLLGYSAASRAVIHMTMELETPGETMVVGAIQQIIGLIFVAAAFDLGLTRLDGETPSVSGSLTLGLRKFLPLFLAILLQQLIVMVHSFFLIVPGIVKALSYSVIVPLVVSGEAGAISCLHESWLRLHGHRKNIAPLMIALWLPTLVASYFSMGLLADPNALSESPLLIAVDVLYPLLDIPWLFVALTLHARLRKHFRLAAEP